MDDRFTDEELTSRLGAWPEGGGVRFRVWAPRAKNVELVLMIEGDPRKRVFSMEPDDRGYHEAFSREATVGSRYFYRLDGGKELPDPASRFQPEGVHGPSQIVTDFFEWNDDSWQGLPLEQLVIYELHVGTFSQEGTFEGVERRLGHLKSLGVNAIEIMPVAQYPGRRNWGYDGVGLFAVQNSYSVGGEQSPIAPLALKRLIDRCHAAGIAVILDVVYNHLGPEGNYLSQFGPYFQGKYHTPWGDAINYDGEWSDEVREYFLTNARQWLEEYHFDGLRLDAVHAIFDTSARPFLEELSDLKASLETRLGRKLHLIAESDANDSRLLKPPAEGGQGMDGQWADDLHHSIHSLLTGERHGYYADYGNVSQLAEAFRDGIIYDGEYSEFRHRSHGRPYKGIDRCRLVVCAQNHDQIGNRMNGDRLLTLVGPEKQRLAAACVFLSPYLPLIFMGEEYGETAPFLYFVDHTDPSLIEAVRKGRKEEFSSFAWQGEPPDAASIETFERSKLNWDKVESDESAQRLMDYYRRLIELSKWIRSERLLERDHVQVELSSDQNLLNVKGWSESWELQLLFSFSSENTKVKTDLSPGALETVLKTWDDTVSFSLAGAASRRSASNSVSSQSSDEIELRPFSAVAMRRARARSI